MFYQTVLHIAIGILGIRLTLIRGETILNLRRTMAHGDEPVKKFDNVPNYPRTRLSNFKKFNPARGQGVLRSPEISRKTMNKIQSLKNDERGIILLKIHDAARHNVAPYERTKGNRMQKFTERVSSGYKSNDRRFKNKKQKQRISGVEAKL